MFVVDDTIESYIGFSNKINEKEENVPWVVFQAWGLVQSDFLGFLARLELDWSKVSQNCQKTEPDHKKPVKTKTGLHPVFYIKPEYKI